MVRRASEEKFRRWFSVADARELSDRPADLAEIVDDPMYVPRAIEDDPSDDYLVAVARHDGAQLLLTGDHGIHRSLRDAADVKAVSPAGFLRELDD